MLRSQGTLTSVVKDGEITTNKTLIPNYLKGTELACQLEWFFREVTHGELQADCQIWRAASSNTTLGQKIFEDSFVGIIRKLVCKCEREAQSLRRFGVENHVVLFTASNVRVVDGIGELRYKGKIMMFMIELENGAYRGFNILEWDGKEVRVVHTVSK